MQSELQLPVLVQPLLCCPRCRGNLKLLGSEQYQCKNLECNLLFPVRDGIPILIDEEASIFSIDDFLYSQNIYFDLTPQNPVKQFIKRFIPGTSRNVKAVSNYQHFIKLLLTQSNLPNVLVLGGSILGQGMKVVVEYPAEIVLVESDVSFGPRTDVIFDAHSIPFKDNSFDGVIVQAVLEHVVDPYKCVEEIHRVLKKDGLVYAETPFMQQVHGGCYDFTRFTHLGHRRLFRKFEEIESGAVCGPGMALAWSYSYFLLSFTKSKFLRILLGVFARFTSFYLTYFDELLINKAGTLDAASGYYFIGRKSDSILSDKELIKLYKGAF
ncbi:MAG: methyltransferase domain-containing protein [Pleurocapsa sp. SU_5_0]|nr:methyltransferase domain-containing protein [Pleurocapsa sp. SU_5_0]NJM60000.1 methyltransferase domain-containing protein [Oscillatoriales cyanobacterium RU_3_3]